MLVAVAMVEEPMTGIDLESLRAKFIKSYAAVPDKLREEIIALVNERPFNWNTAFIEVKGGTKAGDAILRHVGSLGILEDEKRE